MLSLMPLPYKLAAIALAVALSASVGFWQGKDYVQDKWERENQAQTIANQKKELENAEIVLGVANAYNSESDRLRAKLRAMSKATHNPCSTPQADGERGGVSQDAFYANSMQCELQLKHIREWVSRVSIPVK